ncbi:MAG: GNAT family N-acetyltransferase [Paracoccaceae bacterium]
MNIRPLDVLENTAELRALVRAYLDHEIRQLRAISGMDLDTDELVANTFDHIEAYLPPEGALHLALGEEDRMIGCVFLKMIGADACEIKRLYVTPDARGSGLGRALMESILTEAQRLGAKRVLLDTGVYDKAAQALYRKLGFREIDYYPEGENDPEMRPYLVYMELVF